MLSKVEMIKEKLLDDIRSGRLCKGDRISSRHQFMHRYDCARGTIDQAIRELATAGFLRSRKGSGTFVSDSEQMRGRIAQVIVIGHGPVHGGWFTDEDFTQRRSIGIACEIQESIPCFVFRSTDIGVNLHRIACSGSAVIWTCPPYEHLHMMKHLDRLGIPQILIGRNYCPFDYVTTDARTGIIEGLRWLQQVSGASDVTFVSEEANSERPYLAERQIAFYEAASELGCFPVAGNILIPSFRDLSRVVKDLGNRLFQSEKRPRAIFLTQFQAALPLVSYATACGLDPGRDFHLLTFDEERSLRPYRGIAMLKQRWDQMKLEAIRWVNRLREGNPEPVRLRIPPELIVCGESNLD